MSPPALRSTHCRRRRAEGAVFLLIWIRTQADHIGYPLVYVHLSCVLHGQRSLCGRGGNTLLVHGLEIEPLSLLIRSFQGIPRMWSRHLDHMEDIQRCSYCIQVVQLSLAYSSVFSTKALHTATLVVVVSLKFSQTLFRSLA